MPIVAAGDFNFDIHYLDRNINKACHEFIRGRVWRWVKPRPYVDTNWSDRDGDGVDDYFHSILDTVFLANGVP